MIGPATVVAIVPAKDRADSVAATVTALRTLDRVDRVVVVDDGSVDETVAVARAAGAEVLKLPSNRGKGGAVLAAVQATPGTGVYLLIDADLATTAGAADLLLAPVLAGEADMTVGVLPPAGGRGGFGRVRDLAGRGIRRACGLEVRAPLSGQRAVRADLLRDLRSAERFGLEVALTIDAARAGARILDVDVPMDHRHTGRTVAGVRHRAGQGIDVVRALWPRVTSRAQRTGLLVSLFVVILVAALWSGRNWTPSSEALPERPDRVIVFGMAPLGFNDLDRGNTPNLDRLMDRGAVAAMSVRTVSRTPTLEEGYLSLGAGYRLDAGAEAAEVYEVGEQLSSGTAAQVLEARTGFVATGDLAVVGGGPALDANDDDTIDSQPGGLGDALAAAGRQGAAVGNADQPGTPGGPDVISRPAALAVMDGQLSVPAGAVAPGRVLMEDPSAPFGVRADPDRMLAEVRAAARRAEVVVVDPGDLARAEAFADIATSRAQERARATAVARTDALLGRILRAAGPRTLVLAVSIAPPGATFGLAPMVAVGPGVPTGYLFSPSTKRAGIVAITDLAPTVLDALGVAVPDEMPGHALRYREADINREMLVELDRDTSFRERTYPSWTVWFIVFQAVVYLIGALVVSRRSRLGRLGPVLRLLALGAASFPLATFVYRMIPDSAAFDGASTVVLLAISAAIVGLATRARRTPLSPLNVVMAATMAVIAVDACTGTWLHVDSWLGYSLHNAGRFYGIPNTTYAVLAASTLLLAAGVVQYASRKSEALVAVALLLLLVAVIDGAPSLGGDVGGIVSLIPLFGLTFVALSGRRPRGRTVVVLGVVTLLALALATGVDLMRSTDAQTHLGRFATRLSENGPSELTDTFLRKQSANFRILQVSTWAWMIPIAALFALYVLGWDRQGRDLLPAGSPVRAGAVAVTAGAMFGFLANDSGPQVIALFVVYLLPFITLLALDHQRGSPILLPPVSPAPGAPERPDIDVVAVPVD